MKNELSIYQTLERVMTNVGYIDAATGTHRCFVRDYLGNVRSVIDNSGHVLEHDGYYPYGALANAAASSVQPLKFGGKELERYEGVDDYDFGARWYNATSLTTSTADPLAAETPQLSPYAWCAGNPLRNIDPTGRLASDVQ